MLDATVGVGGHAKEVLKRITPGGFLIGMDADEEALKIAEKNLVEFYGSFKLINDNFRVLDTILSDEGVKSLKGALFDTGVSSYQLEEASRGFSIKNDGPLDMRMDRRLKVKAYDIVNRYREEEISRIIGELGEERFHNRIAKYIVFERSKKPIETTRELANIIHKAVGSRYGKRRIDPATRTFQAIRIAVNDELTALEEGLKKAISYLDTGARISVISFHSLEDRIVKNIFKKYARDGILNIITKKPVRPSRQEMSENPRSRSAKLRVGERL